MEPPPPLPDADGGGAAPPAPPHPPTHPHSHPHSSSPTRAEGEESIAKPAEDISKSTSSVPSAHQNGVPAHEPSSSPSNAQENMAETKDESAGRNESNAAKVVKREKGDTTESTIGEAAAADEPNMPKQTKATDLVDAPRPEIKSDPKTEAEEQKQITASENLRLSLSKSRSSSITKRPSLRRPSPASAPQVAYQGIDMRQACATGNLPVCVLLWGMASAKNVSLLCADDEGNNPIHYAALAPTNEVLVFLMQQSRGMFAPGVRLVDSTNADGETALLRAMRPGRITIAKSLLQAGASAMVHDVTGKTVVINCAKSGQLWMLHWMMTYVEERLGPQEAQQLLQHRDIDSHGPFDWAANAGDVNVMEYLIRKGCDAWSVDPKGRTALHWAARKHNVAACRFLVLYGLDPNLKDQAGQSAFSIAQSKRDFPLLRALHTHRPASLGPPIRTDPEARPTGSNRVLAANIAIHRENPSDWLMVFIWAFCTGGLWLLSIPMPWFAYAILIGILGYLYITADKGLTAVQQNVKPDEKVVFSFWQSSIVAPEKFLGFWAGSTISIGFYLLYAGIALSPHDVSSPTDARTRHLGAYAIAHHIATYFWLWLLYLLTFFMWARLVWWDTDPGTVRTRDRDFTRALNSAIENEDTPSADKWCRTTLVRKPLRSKYCTNSGFVVARMDHWCVWLNVAVGFKNHRPFVLFIMTHFLFNLVFVGAMISAFVEELSTRHGSYIGCQVVDALLGERYFFPLMLTLFIALVTVGFLMLLQEQLYNMCVNRTTNERINYRRYEWMYPVNRYDRGVFVNVCEFWRVRGYEIDYFNTFDLPPARTPAPHARTSGDGVSTNPWPSLRGLFSHSHHSHSHHEEDEDKSEVAMTSQPVKSTQDVEQGAPEQKVAL